jgi:hypothetical protein
MALDTYDLAKLFTPPSEDEFLRGRFGTIKQVNSNGTADVLLDGSVSTQCFANWGGAQVGSRCMVSSKGTDWIISAVSESGGTIECANFCIEASANKDPRSGWVWKKYADGTAELERMFATAAVQISTAWGGGYISAS